MNQTHHFGAPWGWAIMVVTTSMVLMFGGFLIVAATRGDAVGIGWPLLILFASALSLIRGYELAGDVLVIERLGWHSKVKLHGLRSVVINPPRSRLSIRVGNGGFFSICGWFWNRKLGWYRVFATDPRLAVLLLFDHRKVVITPDDPELFAAQAKGLTRLA